MKNELGITPWSQLRDSVTDRYHNLQTTTAYVSLVSLLGCIGTALYSIEKPSNSTACLETSLDLNKALKSP